MPKLMPNLKNIEFKEKFIEHYSKLTDWKEFKKYSTSFLRRSIRVNTLKISVPDLKKKMVNWKFKKIPWCKNSFWIEHKTGRRDIGNTMEHGLGYIYVQESASMIPAVVLNPKQDEIILDMCASPGSKTTQIAELMKSKGLLVANDISQLKINPLSVNLQRMGITNSIITMMKGQFFRNLEFDRILVDAPCSGTGAIRKSLKTLRIWNPAMIRQFARTQKQLIETAFRNLKKQGTLVYSTCSLEPEENEAVVDFLIKKYKNAKLQDIKLNIKRSSAILEFKKQKYSSEIKKCLRIWPQDNDTEGFFIAKIKKN